MTAECPACSCKRSNPTYLAQVYECAKCGAIHGDCYFGDSYDLVKPYFTTDPDADGRHRYFDLTCFGSQGVTRRHGWYDPETRLITQVG